MVGDFSGSLIPEKHLAQMIGEAIGHADGTATYLCEGNGGVECHFGHSSCFYLDEELMLIGDGDRKAGVMRVARALSTANPLKSSFRPFESLLHPSNDQNE